jgi:hypothetical protein
MGRPTSRVGSLVAVAEEFDFEAMRRRFSEHRDDDGRPVVGSMWRSRMHPHMRVLVVARDRDLEIQAMVYRDADLDGLRLPFTHETTERWNIARDGAVYGSPGIDQEHHWRGESDTPSLIVTFDRSRFGGADTWHIGREET